MIARSAARGLAAFVLLGLLSACAQQGAQDAKTARLDTNPIDNLNLNDIMLTVADAEDAVEYFRKTLAQNPDREDLQRGYAYALMRARKYPEARLAFRALIEAGRAQPADRVEYAHALARLEQWDDVAAQLALLPEGFVSARRLMLEALLADHRRDWAAADAAYERARQMAAQPAPVYNNWGVSKMARGDFAGAEEAFEKALTYDPSLFSAKNNLALTYGLQRRYRLPLVFMTDEERAILKHNLGLLALRQGDKAVARGLFAEAVEAHPRHFEAAAAKLAALDE